MTHDHHTTSAAHRELVEHGAAYLKRLVKDWADPFPVPLVEHVPLDATRVIRVVRDDLYQFGTKARAASAILHQPEYRDAPTIVYVAPRAGWAAISLAKVCSLQNRRLILFCPAAGEPSHHQRVTFELGADLRFLRVAAMPNLQAAAQRFAARHKYVFFPMGLAVPAAVAAIGKVAQGLRLRHVQEVWCAASTGVLTRGLQLAWPQARHRVVAVARNLKDGERGTAITFSHPLPFLRDAPINERPPYPSAANYDSKVWIYALAHASHNAVCWNVAGEINLPFTKPLPRSTRAWGDDQDLEKP